MSKIRVATIRAHGEKDGDSGNAIHTQKNLVHKIFSPTFGFFWCISHFCGRQARKKTGIYRDEIMAN